VAEAGRLNGRGWYCHSQKIIEDRFHVFQRFSSSKLVLETVGRRFAALNYYENGSRLGGGSYGGTQCEASSFTRAPRLWRAVMRAQVCVCVDSTAEVMEARSVRHHLSCALGIKSGRTYEMLSPIVGHYMVQIRMCILCKVKIGDLCGNGFIITSLYGMVLQNQLRALCSCHEFESESESESEYSRSFVLSYG
jgi:hypothetical protein